MKKPKAIIVGGGIGGLATAIALDKIGFDYIVLEQSPQISEVGASILIWNNGTHCLNELGVEDKFWEKAISIDEVSVQNHQGKILTKLNFSNSQEQFKISASTIHRADLINILLQPIPSEKIFLNSKIQSFLEDSKGVTVKLNSNKELRGDLLIGADGIHSIIRKGLMDNRTLRYAGYTCWRGLLTIDHESLPDTRTAVLGMGPKSMYGSSWLKNKQFYWFATALSQPNPSKELKLNSLKKAFSIWPQSIREIINQTPVSSIIRNDIYDLPPIKNWGKGFCTLLGDAAHATTPNLAQGGCMALEDAVELAHSLFKYSNKQQALRAFERKRYSRTANIVRDSKFFGEMSQWRHPLLLKIRNSSAAIWFSKRGMKKYAGYRVPPLKDSLAFTRL